MSQKINSKFLKNLLLLSTGFILIAGIYFRFYKIAEDQFVYYDEGMWLNANRNFVDLVGANPPQNFGQFFKILRLSARISLGTAKALWAFITSLRVFFAQADSWYFVRIVSAVFGSLTLFVTYLFARRYYDSKWVGLLSLAVLAVLPSHVYYSRLGLQEAFSTFCFVSGLYLYVFSKKAGIKAVLSAILFSFVYFSNYRMIIIPGIVLFCEIYMSLMNKVIPDYKKYIVNTVIFSILVFGVGSIKAGEYTNLYITFAWMFRQANMAKGHFDILNLFSYPYYLFSLESIFFCALFFGNLYFVFKKEYRKAFPFFLVLLLMIPFSFFLEKGVRYLCAVMPFMAISVSALIYYLYEEVRTLRHKMMVLSFAVLMMASHVVNCINIINFNTAYKISVYDIRRTDPFPKIVSTQNMVQSLFVKKQENVVGLKPKLVDLVDYYKKGYRYLIIDPQAYVYLEDNEKRFGRELPDFIKYILKYVPAYRKYDHFKKDLLRRFVLEHNENLRNSLAFLRSNKDGDLGALRVYDIGIALSFIKNSSLK